MVKINDKFTQNEAEIQQFMVKKRPAISSFSTEIEAPSQSRGIFTKKEFFRLIDIQTGFRYSILKEENARFYKFLNNPPKGLSFSSQDREICISTRNNIFKKIETKIKRHIEYEEWNSGVIKIKDKFCLAHHIALIPPIYARWGHLKGKDVECDCDEESVNFVMFKDFPELANTLSNIFANYQLMREVYIKEGLALKLRYNEEIPHTKFKTFKLSTVRQILNEINKTLLENNRKLKENKKSLEKNQKEQLIKEKEITIKQKHLEVLKYLKEGKRYREIQELTGYSLSQISFISNNIPKT